MTRLELLGIVAFVGGFGLFCFWLFDSIRWRLTRRATKQEIKAIGLDVDGLEAAYYRTRERELRAWTRD